MANVDDDEVLPLPAYEPTTPAQAVFSPPPTQSTIPGSNNLRDIDTTAFIGSGGVRIPLSQTEKDREDLRNQSHLASFGTQVWVRGFDEQHEWDPCACYKSAISQLDLLLPLLSLPTGQLPVTTAFRTVMIRLPDLPGPDLGYHTLTEGRGEIGRALKTWLMKPTVEPTSMWAFADMLVRRVRNDGFVVVEEWWDFGGAFLQLVVRC